MSTKKIRKNIFQPTAKGAIKLKNGIIIYPTITKGMRKSIQKSSISSASESNS